MKYLLILLLAIMIIGCGDNILTSERQCKVSVINTSIGNSITKIVINDINVLQNEIHSLDTGSFMIQPGIYNLVVTIGESKYIENNLDVNKDMTIYLPN